MRWQDVASADAAVLQTCVRQIEALKDTLAHSTATFLALLVKKGLVTTEEYESAFMGGMLNEALRQELGAGSDGNDKPGGEAATPAVSEPRDGSSGEGKSPA